MAAALWRCNHCGSEFPAGARRLWVTCYRCSCICREVGRLVNCGDYDLKVRWLSWE